MQRLSQSNATPLIGVLLVLLAVPFITYRAVEVQMPRELDDCRPEPWVYPSVWTLHADGSATLDDRRGVQRLAPVEVFHARFIPATPVVYVEAEPEVPWGEVVGFVDRIKERAPEFAIVALSMERGLSESDP